MLDSHRRNFLKAGVAIAFASVIKAAENISQSEEEKVRAYLRRLMPSRQQVHDFLHGVQGPEKLSRNQGWLYDAQLGWILCDSIRPRSVDNSKGFYSYEKDGARKIVNFPDRPSRIHTYGDSFTHCDQVSDGETWQEYLAGHLQEPIRNYGVGGYGVYQAYRRMLKVEKETPADYIILNIWDDDHYRNLDSWRAIRFAGRTPCGYTLPFLLVNVARQECKKLENICPKAEDVYKLCDEDFVWQTFKDDVVLKVMLAQRGGEDVARKLMGPVSQSFGIEDNKILSLAPQQAIRKMHTEAALWATRQIVTWTEQFIEQTGKKLMLILSFSQGSIARELNGQPAFDRSFTEWLKDKPYPVIDMRDFFKADYEKFKGNANEYLRRYYIGHHNPSGNFFTACALKDRIVKWLDPVPLPYL